jgi:hypothetical protein
MWLYLQLITVVWTKYRAVLYKDKGMFADFKNNMDRPVTDFSETCREIPRQKECESFSLLGPSLSRINRIEYASSSRRISINYVLSVCCVVRLLI